MKFKTKSTIFILIFLLGFLPFDYNQSYGDRRDRKKRSMSSWKKRFNYRGKKSVKLTFIDSLNKGKEISLLDVNMQMIASLDKDVTPPGKKIKENGFRIQLLASSSAENIRSKKKTVEAELHVNTYIVFEKPYYKIYAGDFITRQEAEGAIGKIKRAGYPDAWIVESRIFVND